MIIMNKSEKYIKKLEENRRLALEYITKAIDSNNTSICLNVDDVIIMTLLNDGVNDKNNNEALCNARGTIKSLISEIRNASSEEEIVNVRKKLNYYLNKVKSLMKQKEVSEENITLYSNIVKELRNNIGEYLRLVKRNDYVFSLKELASKEILTEEEEKLLENSYERERRFNTRLLKKYNPNYKKTVGKKSSKNEEKEESVSDPSAVRPKNIEITENATSLLNPDTKVELNREGEVLVDKPVEEKKKTFKEMVEESRRASLERKIDLEPSVEEDEKGMVLVRNPNPAPVSGRINFDFERPQISRREFKSPEELLRSDFARYNLVRANPYGNGLVKDLGALFKNVPIYLANKRSLKIMIRDFNNFCSSETLSNLIDFTIYENSFKKAFLNVFSPKRRRNSMDYQMDTIRQVVYDDSEDLESEVFLRKI